MYLFIDETQSHLDEVIEEHTAEDGILSDYLNDKDAVDTKAVNAKINELKKTDPDKRFEYRMPRPTKKKPHTARCGVSFW